MVKKLAQYYHMKRYKNVSKYIITLMCTCCVACTQPKVQNLTILHSNDTHSQVESLEEGKRDAHCGGYARRMGFITQQRELDPNILLLDGGDFCQGTPYFNFYHGRVEVEAMNYMKYDVVTLGNHEFDYGVDTLAAMLKTAKFDIVCANYDVTNSPLEDIVKPYTIIRRGNLRIGVFGIGVEPTGLITEKNFHPLQLAGVILMVPGTQFFTSILISVVATIVPKWLEADMENLSGKVIALPLREDIGMDIREQLIVELYSK